MSLTWTKSPSGIETSEQNGVTYQACIHSARVRMPTIGFVLDEDHCEGQVEHFKMLCQLHADSVQKAVDEAVEKALYEAGHDSPRTSFEEDQEDVIKELSEQLTQSRALCEQLGETLKTIMGSKSYLSERAFNAVDKALSAYHASKNNLDSQHGGKRAAETLGSNAGVVAEAADSTILKNQLRSDAEQSQPKAGSNPAESTPPLIKDVDLWPTPSPETASLREPCIICKGQGSYLQTNWDKEGFPQEDAKCPYCKGTGLEASPQRKVGGK